MAQIRYEHISKRFGSVVAVHDFDLTIEDKEFLTLVGPSGCGKSTTLNITAGLEDPSSGHLYIDERLVNAVPPGDRDIAMVFQSYALYPHKTVRDNIGFGLKVRKMDKREIERRVQEAAALLGIADLLDRKPRALSGGQRQRVALGRAITRNPKVFLLDEPLSNLDAKLREKMRFELKRLQAELNVTSVYVTHDQNEALGLSHLIAVMDQGRIVQVGSPRDIYEQPKNRFVAEFVGTANFIPGQIRDRHVDPHGYVVETALGNLVVASTRTLQAGDKIVLSIRPEHVNIGHGEPSGINNWDATVKTSIFLGFYQDLELVSGALCLEARAHPSLGLPVGAKVAISIAPDRCIVCD